VTFNGDTVPGAFAAAVAADPTRPLLTYYNDGTGERTELSGATLDNWVAKTANMLVDGYGLGPGDRAAVVLPPHWQTAAVLLGCWSAGLIVAHLESSVSDSPADVGFVTADRLDAVRAPERFVLGLAPMAMPMREVPESFTDYVVEVRGYGDRFSAYPRKDREDLVRRATERAAALGVRRGARVLVDAARHADPLDWLLAPLVSGASIVLCGALDGRLLADRVAAERVDVTLAG
jgi:uncharacterized protein (TIGR03089 family)